jgi:hypothetical protein
MFTEDDVFHRWSDNRPIHEDAVLRERQSAADHFSHNPV